MSRLLPPYIFIAAPLLALSGCGTFDPDPCGCVVRSPDCPDTPTPEECEKEAEPSVDAGAAAQTSTRSK